MILPAPYTELVSIGALNFSTLAAIMEPFSLSFVLSLLLECILAGADKLGLMGKLLCKIINR